MASSVTLEQGLSAPFDLEKLPGLHIFDILALVFQLFQLPTTDKLAFKARDAVFDSIQSHIGSTLWIKILEICRNSRPEANSKLSLLKVINFTGTANNKCVVSRCASFATRLVLLQSVLHSRTSSNMSDSHNETTLMLSICMGREQLVRKLLEVSPLARILQFSTHPYSLGQDAFLMALVANRLEMANMILEQLLQHANFGSLAFHDYSQMLCRIYCRNDKTSKKLGDTVCIPSLLLLIRMGASRSMLDLIHKIALKCWMRCSSKDEVNLDNFVPSNSVAAGARGLMLLVSNLRDGLGNNALHHVSPVVT